MKPIEGIELGDIYAEVQAARLKEQRIAIAGKVSGIYTNILQWQQGKARADSESKKLGEKIAKAQDKLQKIRDGDWTVLQEEQKDGEDKKTSSGSPSPDD